jgi:Sporulation and spore germination.
MNKLLLLAIVLTISSTAFAQKAQTMSIKLYYLNTTNDPNLEDCRAVKPLTRVIPKTAGVARAALDEYLKGPSAEEQKRGFTGFGPPETTGILKSIKIKNGAAYVDFDKKIMEQLGSASTSCGGGFFVGLEKTLTQFSTIKKDRVFYAIERNPAEFYDWAQVGECPEGLKNCDASNF